MSKCLLPTHPLLFFSLQTLPNEIFGNLGDGRVKYNRFSVDIVDELELVIGRPGGKPMQHLVIDQPY